MNVHPIINLPTQDTQVLNITAFVKFDIKCEYFREYGVYQYVSPLSIISETMFKRTSRGWYAFSAI